MKPNKKRPNARRRSENSRKRNEKTAGASGSESATTTTDTAVHLTAARGFTDGELYERGRPGYPPAAIDALKVTDATKIADLGCGTGKLTKLLVDRRARVIGIEPLPAMLSAFTEQCPGTPVISALAEVLPFGDEEFDIVACASAFHWFRHDLAIPEIHRVLKPKGRLAIIWNRRDRLTGQSPDWAAGFWAITEEHRHDTPGYRTGAWRTAIEGSRLFGPITEQRFEHIQRTDSEGLLARVMSISFIETLPAAVREEVLQSARRFIEEHPQTRGRDVLELPYSTALYVTQRLE